MESRAGQQRRRLVSRRREKLKLSVNFVTECEGGDCFVCKVDPISVHICAFAVSAPTYCGWLLHNNANNSLVAPPRSSFTPLALPFSHLLRNSPECLDRIWHRWLQSLNWTNVIVLPQAPLFCCDKLGQKAGSTNLVPMS